MTENEFTCSNGHAFTANAKIRARCPECGSMARRDFKATAPKVTEPKVDEPKVEPKPPTVLKPVLLKQGRPRIMATKPKPAVKPAVATKTKRPVKPSLISKGGKTSAGLVKSTRIKTRGTMPTIKGKPIRTAPARTVQSGNPRSSKPFWHDVAEKYGI